MPISLKDFFTPRNTVDALDERLYVNQPALIRIAEAFARSLYQPVIVIDLYKRNLLYMSGNFQYMFGILPDKDPMDNDRLFFDFVPEEEQQMLLEVMDRAFELLYSLPVDERLEWSLSYYLTIDSGEKRRLVHQTVTSMYLSPQGKVWLAMCTFSLSSRKDPGHPSLRHYRHPDYFIYSFKKHVWFYKEGVVLSDVERDILILSSQGYIMKEIAVKIGKSEDTVKFYKRQLFAKLGVKNNTEAVFAAINDNLLI